MNADIHIVREYPHPRTKVWKALTDPALMALWGMRPEGFAPIVGTRFRLIGRANRAWRGYVDCQILEVSEPRTIAYTWIDNEGAPTRHVRNTLDETETGTRLTIEHRGFSGLGGTLFSHLVMRPGLRKTLAAIGAVLADADTDTGDSGKLRSGSSLVGGTL